MKYGVLDLEHNRNIIESNIYQIFVFQCLLQNNVEQTENVVSMKSSLCWSFSVEESLNLI